MPPLRYTRFFFYALRGPPLSSMQFVDSAEPLLPKRVGLLTTTQFRHWLPAIKEHLEKKGHVIRIGEPDRRVRGAGPVPRWGLPTTTGGWEERGSVHFACAG